MPGDRQCDPWVSKAEPPSLGAPSVIGMRARDLGDVWPSGGYRDLQGPAGRCRIEDSVLMYSRNLAEPIAAAASQGAFVLLLGGYCSILLGALLGLRNAWAAPIGQVYIDAHADFATLCESPSRSACSMNLALAVGRVDRPLAHLAGDGALVGGEHVVHIGRREHALPEYGHPALASFGVLRPIRSDAATESVGIAGVARKALERVAGIGAGFWIHFDVDALDPDLMPAVHSPLPGGLDFAQAAELLAKLAQQPAALGLQVTIYYPAIDTTGNGAAKPVGMLERAFTATGW
jgi:arginase